MGEVEAEVDVLDSEGLIQFHCMTGEDILPTAEFHNLETMNCILHQRNADICCNTIEPNVPGNVSYAEWSSLEWNN